MQTINIRITIALAVLATAAWGYTAYYIARWYTPPTSYFVLSSALTFCACLGWVMLTITAARGDSETRCRKCGYILKGLSEPRCPECGTPI